MLVVSLTGSPAFHYSTSQMATYSHNTQAPLQHPFDRQPSRPPVQPLLQSQYCPAGIQFVPSYQHHQQFIPPPNFTQRPVFLATQGSQPVLSLHNYPFTFEANHHGGQDIEVYSQNPQLLALPQQGQILFQSQPRPPSVQMYAQAAPPCQHYHVSQASDPSLVMTSQHDVLLPYYQPTQGPSQQSQPELQETQDASEPLPTRHDRGSGHSPKPVPDWRDTNDCYDCCRNSEVCVRKMVDGRVWRNEQGLSSCARCSALGWYICREMTNSQWSSMKRRCRQCAESRTDGFLCGVRRPCRRCRAKGWADKCEPNVMK